jgi:hypothetical protein
LAASVGRVLSDGALQRRPDAAERSPGERSILDDMAVRRPWNLVVKAARSSARARLRWLRPGVTVIIVNWNTRDVTADVVRAVQRLSPPETRVLLIDNGSTDGSRELFRTWPGIRFVALPSNAGHGVALDLGVCLTRTVIAVTLDSDAIPLRTGWLEPATVPLLRCRAKLAGLQSSRGFVHPVYLAVDVETFVRRNLSFQVHRDPSAAVDDEEYGVNVWDAAEWMFRSFAASEMCFVSSRLGVVDGSAGQQLVGDVVYHHGGLSRSQEGGVSPEGLAEWRRACRVVRDNVVDLRATNPRHG